MDYYTSYLILVPAIILTFIAQIRVKSAFSKYSNISNSKGITGYEAARIILQQNGMGMMPINIVSGKLTDNYNPGKKNLNLSNSVYNGSSIASIAVAAHECGHACQDNEDYALLRFRNNLIPIVNLGSNLAWPLLIIGVFLGFAGLYKTGLILFLTVILFHLVTLPMELNASKRGLEMLCGYGIIENGSSEYKGAKSVLSAAALTYLAALTMAIANFLRMLAIANSRKD